MKLKKDLKGDVNLISNYFPKRTFISIQHKLDSIETKKNGKN